MRLMPSWRLNTPVERSSAVDLIRRTRTAVWPPSRRRLAATAPLTFVARPQADLLHLFC